MKLVILQIFAPEIKTILNFNTFKALVQPLP